MNLKDIQRNEEEREKKVPINIRVSLEISEWMKYRNVSPTLLFEKTAMELIYKDEEWNRKQAHELKKKQLLQPKE